MKIEPETIPRRSVDVLVWKRFSKGEKLLHSMLQVCLYARNIIIIIFYLATTLDCEDLLTLA